LRFNYCVLVETSMYYISIHGVYVSQHIYFCANICLERHSMITKILSPVAHPQKKCDALSVSNIFISLFSRERGFAFPPTDNQSSNRQIRDVALFHFGCFFYQRPHKTAREIRPFTCFHQRRCALCVEISYTYIMHALDWKNVYTMSTKIYKLSFSVTISRTRAEKGSRALSIRMLNQIRRSISFITIETLKTE
jgi:hypothetical protein